jgi:hypothetical protein
VKDGPRAQIHFIEIRASRLNGAPRAGSAPFKTAAAGDDNARRDIGVNEIDTGTKDAMDRRPIGSRPSRGPRGAA